MDVVLLGRLLGTCRLLLLELLLLIDLALQLLEEQLVRLTNVPTDSLVLVQQGHQLGLLLEIYRVLGHSSSVWLLLLLRNRVVAVPGWSRTVLLGEWSLLVTNESLVAVWLGRLLHLLTMRWSLVVECEIAFYSLELGLLLRLLLLLMLLS